jgi:rifampicin phosphotransferase
MTAPSPEITFELPAGCDPTATWSFDPMHNARPLPLLGQELVRANMEHAFGLEVAFVHGYQFSKNFTPPPPTQEVLARGIGIWEEDFVPRIAAFCERTRNADYAAETAESLVDALPGLFSAAAEAFQYTMIIVFVFMGPTMALVEFSEQVLGADGPLLVASMLQGYANESSAAGEGLGELTRLASRLPAVAQALRAGRVADLGEVEGGAEFQRALGDYLAKYGWRAESWGMAHLPTWAEDPTAPLRLIATFLGNDDASPDTALRRSTEVRLVAEREVQSRLSGQPLEQFMAMLAVAKPHVAVSEGRAFWQLTIAGSLRVPVLALGRKLQASGALADPNDAFFLSIAELREAAGSPSRTAFALVEARKLELANSTTLQPPPFLGTPPRADLMPVEVAAVFRRFFGMGVKPSTDAALITGNAGSKGVVRGRARVIRELAEADRLEPGDILVCAMTAPPWTPLFAIAGGVVTDAGGVLSHSAICAREFAIPCVVGTQVGTTLIRDGAFITVDGDHGVVRLEP